VGQLLEFRGRLLNAGNVTDHDIALEVAAPSGGNGEVVPGSCRLQRPGARETRCADALDERHLRVAQLAPGQSVSVRFLLRTQSPPCNGYQAETTFTAWSEDRPAISDRVDGVVAGGTHIACGTDEARLMALISAAYRGRCRVGEVSNNIAGAKAHIACPNPTAGVETIEYYSFATQQQADDELDLRKKSVDQSSWRQCYTDPDGEGTFNYDGRSEPELRYLCWYDGDGNPPGSWVEMVNERYQLYLFAHRTDDRLTDLFNWTNNNTP
jgi:hypothetical protein